MILKCLKYKLKNVVKYKKKCFLVIGGNIVL